METGFRSLELHVEDAWVLVLMVMESWYQVPPKSAKGFGVT